MLVLRSAPDASSEDTRRALLSSEVRACVDIRLSAL